MIKTISKCRVCGNAALETVMSLGNLSLTGVFPKSRNENITSGPVDLVMCIGESTCGLVQLKQSYNIEEMYADNYGYRSGLNKTMVAHLETKVAKILAMNVLEDNDVIIVFAIFHYLNPLHPLPNLSQISLSCFSCS